MLRVLAMPPDTPERGGGDQIHERIALEHRLARIAERLRQLQEDRSQAMRAAREQWPLLERRQRERRRP